MKKPKAFDCVEMKNEIQRKLQAEFPDLPEMEKRRLQLERVRQNPLLAPLLERMAASQPRGRGK